jgi:hypothetical protein
MDRTWGSKPGSGGAASAQNESIDRRERLRRLALETIDLAKDPYFMRNHLGRQVVTSHMPDRFSLSLPLIPGRCLESAQRVYLCHFSTSAFPSNKVLSV